MSAQRKLADRLPPAYAAIARKLQGSFSEREAWAIARMLHELDMGAGEVTAVEILQREGGFTEQKARALVRLYASLKEIARAA